MMIMSLLQNNNPQQAVMQLAQQSGDPMINSLVQMAQRGDNQGIQQFAQNFFNQRGMNFGTEMQRFMSMMGKR